MIVCDILSRGRRWKKLLSQDIPGGVVEGMRRLEIEQSFIDGLLFYARMSSQKLDLADLLGKSIECLAVRLPNVYGDGRVFHCFHTH